MPRQIKSEYRRNAGYYRHYQINFRIKEDINPLVLEELEDLIFKFLYTIPRTDIKTRKVNKSTGFYG